MATRFSSIGFGWAARTIVSLYADALFFLERGADSNWGRCRWNDVRQNARAASGTVRWRERVAARIHGPLGLGASPWLTQPIADSGYITAEAVGA